VGIVYVVMELTQTISCTQLTIQLSIGYMYAMCIEHKAGVTDKYINVLYRVFISVRCLLHWAWLASVVITATTQPQVAVL